MKEKKEEAGTDRPLGGALLLKPSYGMKWTGVVSCPPSSALAVPEVGKNDRDDEDCPGDRSASAILSAIMALSLSLLHKHKVGRWSTTIIRDKHGVRRLCGGLQARPDALVR